MSKAKKNLIIGIVLIQIVAILAVANLPYIVEFVIPAQYWGVLPDWVVATAGEREEFVPVSEAAAVDDVNADELLSSVGIAPTATPEATPTAVPTQLPPPTDSAAEATPQPTAEPTATPTPIPPTPTPLPPPTTARIDGLQVEAQKFNNCGPTNLAIVLNFYGDPTDQLEAAAYLKPNPQDRNVSPWQISDYVNDFTALKSISRANGDLELLKRLVAAGYPVVIEKGYEPEDGTSTGWYGHYLTMFGYNDETEEFNTIDTFLGPFAERDVKPGFTLEDGLVYSYEYIEYYWQQFNYTFYVVYRPTQEAELFEILGEDLLNDLSMWTNAASRAQEQINSDPEDAFAWFNLGTALTRLGEQTGDQNYYENGAVAFDKAFSIGLPSRMLWYQHRPYIAYMKTGRYDDMLTLANATFADPGGRTIEEAYLYQGHALSFLQDWNGAAEAYQQALELNENLYPAQIGLDYVDSIRFGG